MRKILIASHRSMAEGMKDTLRFLTGMEHIYAISAYMDSTPLGVQINEFKENMSCEDSLVILTDMQGGSVNQEFCPLISDRIHLICGINLPLALAICLVPQEKELNDKMIESLIVESRKQILHMNTFQLAYDGEDE